MMAALHSEHPAVAEPQGWEFPLEELRWALLEALDRGLIGREHARRLFDLAQEDVIQPERLAQHVRKRMSGA